MDKLVVNEDFAPIFTSEKPFLETITILKGLKSSL